MADAGASRQILFNWGRMCRREMGNVQRFRARRSPSPPAMGGNLHRIGFALIKIERTNILIYRFVFHIRRLIRAHRADQQRALEPVRKRCLCFLTPCRNRWQQQDKRQTTNTFPPCTGIHQGFTSLGFFILRQGKWKDSFMGCAYLFSDFS